MIITDVTQGWSNRVNFTDENDVFVGYDMHQSCCECADYFITEHKPPFNPLEISEDSITDVEGYIFDIDYFNASEPEFLDAGSMVIFRLTKEDNPDLYLYLFNCHNGYYGHGFEALISGQVWQADVL